MYKTMITPKVTETKVVFGPCRLSYAHLFTKFAPDGGEGKYQTNVLIPKEETETVNAIKQAIEAGRKAYLSGLGRVLTRGASASDPLTGFLRD